MTNVITGFQQHTALPILTVSSKPSNGSIMMQSPHVSSLNLFKQEKSNWNLFPKFNPCDNQNKNKITTTSMNESAMSTPEGDSEENDKTAKKIAGRKKRVVAGYSIVQYSYLLFGCIIVAKTRTPYYGTGPFVAAGVAHILKDAATNNRLSSDTYKRLNLVLVEAALVSGIGTILMGLNPLEPIVAFIALVNSIKGYGYGLKGWELGKACAKEDIVNGLKSSIKSMAKIPNNIKSAGYWLATLTVGSMKLLKMNEIVQMLFSGSKGVVIGTRLYRLSKLILLTTVCFTLKDAADRNRLEGTTFIELNYLLSFTFATMAAYIYKASNSITILTGAIAFFSASSAFNGISSTMKKNAKSA